jgi:predicted MFS family arabinose efflux permease
VITTFITLLFSDRHWTGAAFAISSFGGAFIVSRMVLPAAVRRFGPTRVARVSLVVEAVGLLAICLAGGPSLVLVGAALTGLGFGPIFPTLGARAMAAASDQAQGTALSFYSVFLDIALGGSGVVGGLFIGRYGSISPFVLGVGCVAAALALTSRPAKALRQASA